MQQSDAHLARLDQLTKEQSEKLIELRIKETDMVAKLETLQDF